MSWKWLRFFKGGDSEKGETGPVEQAAFRDRAQFHQCIQKILGKLERTEKEDARIYYAEIGAVIERCREWVKNGKDSLETKRLALEIGETIRVLVCEVMKREVAGLDEKRLELNAMDQSLVKADRVGRQLHAFIDKTIGEGDVGACFLNLSISNDLVRNETEFSNRKRKILADRAISEEKQRLSKKLAEKLAKTDGIILKDFFREVSRKKDVEQKKFENSIAKDFLRCGEGRVVAQHLGTFQELDSEVACLMIKGGWADLVAEKLDQFEILNEEVALLLATYGQEKMIIVRKVRFDPPAQSLINKIERGLSSAVGGVRA